MYCNLDRELKKAQISKKAFAQRIEMPSTTFYYKLRTGHFTTQEAFLIHSLLGGKKDMKYLFERSASKQG